MYEYKRNEWYILVMTNTILYTVNDLLLLQLLQKLGAIIIIVPTTTRKIESPQLGANVSLHLNMCNLQYFQFTCYEKLVIIMSSDSVLLCRVLVIQCIYMPKQITFAIIIITAL